MAIQISSLPNEVSKNEVVSMVEKNTEAAVNMKIANPLNKNLLWLLMPY